MFRFLRDLLRGEAQRQPYLWATVTLSHAALAIPAWSLAAWLAGPWWAALIASAAYAVWEALQWHPGLTADALLDWAAWTLAAVTLTCIATGDIEAAVAASVAMLLIIAAGVSARL